MMYEGKKEDLLEAIYLQTRKDGVSSVPLSTLIRTLEIPEKEMELLVMELGKEGALQRNPAGDVQLTPEGARLGEQVVKKHHTLEHFLIEMLGVDPEDASREACRLEHHISDEVTGRLSALVKRSTGTIHAGGKGVPVPTLLDLWEGDTGIIVQVDHQGKLNRLRDLGFLPGERILVKRKLKNRALVVAIKGCDIALSPDVASLIRVEKSA